MAKLFESITDLAKHHETIAARRYGVIEVCEGRLVALHFRPWPKLISTVEARWLGGWQHRRRQRDQCLVYYNQPIQHSNFLALKYSVSSLGTTYKTVRRASVVLDEVARIKKSDAIVAEATNRRISDRFFARMGWERHLLNARGRHFIKRFYGKLPDEIPQSLFEELQSTG